MQVRLTSECNTQIQSRECMLNLSSRQFSFEFLSAALSRHAIVRRKDPNAIKLGHKKREHPKIPFWRVYSVVVQFLCNFAQLSCNYRATIVQLSRNYCAIAVQLSCNYRATIVQPCQRISVTFLNILQASTNFSKKFVCAPDVRDLFFLDCDLVWSLSLVLFFLLVVTPSQS